MPLEALDVPSVTRKDMFLSILGKRPDAHSRVVAGCGEVCVVRRETETAHGFSMCGRGRRLFMYLTIPDSSAEAMWVPVQLEASARIAVSCARKMVSTLKVNPFQAVNSPLVEPVSTRHLSCIH